MSKTDLTIQSYLHRGNQLWNRAANHQIFQPQLSPLTFIDWLENLLPSLKPSSRRQYIASVRELLLNMRSGCTDSELNDQLDRAIERSQHMQSSDFNSLIKLPKRWRGRTSSQKSKHLNFDDLRKLVKQSENLRGKWIKPALLWLIANIIVGLRPAEWRYAKLSISDEEAVLIVENAKNTNGRSNGRVRTLNLAHITSNEMGLIRSQLNEAKSHATDDLSWNQYYAGVRNAIYRMTREILPSKKTYPSLYTSRHQFAAESKSSGLSKIEIACLMGHAADDTAGSHYGKRKHGRGNCRVKAIKSEMATVRVVPVKNPSPIKQNIRF